MRNNMAMWDDCNASAQLYTWLAMGNVNEWLRWGLVGAGSFSFSTDLPIGQFDRDVRKQQIETIDSPD